MSNTVTLDQTASAPVLQAGSLLAEYSLTRAHATGRWVAIGTVRSVQLPARTPAWVLVGTGDSRSEAIADLRRQLERAEERRG